MSNSVQRRLRLALGYYARMWHDTTPIERGEYIAKLLLWYLLLSSGGLLVNLIFSLDRSDRRGRVGNIHILDREEDSGATFGRVTTEALQLIQRVDPRRFRRIQREVRVIENRAMGSLGAFYRIGTYQRSKRKCSIHFSRIPRPLADTPDRDYQWCLAYYATILIHEATHGHFYSLGIPYTRNTRAFIERLCVQEEHRFALRLFGGDKQRADRMVPPFEAEGWEKSWSQSSRQRANSNWQAAKKEERERKEKRERE